MSREIKFRAWDKKREKYYYDIEKPCAPDYKAAFVIEQYTGLRDKNGIEIYEGDILADLDRDLLQIVWSEYDCGFIGKWLLESAGYYNDDELGKTCGVYEVVSNIHENKELKESEK